MALIVNTIKLKKVIFLTCYKQKHVKMDQISPVVTIKLTLVNFVVNNKTVNFFLSRDKQHGCRINVPIETFIPSTLIDHQSGVI